MVDSSSWVSSAGVSSAADSSSGASSGASNSSCSAFKLSSVTSTGSLGSESSLSTATENPGSVTVVA